MTILWIGKETRSAIAGDDVYEMKAKKALVEAGYSLCELTVLKVSNLRRILNFMNGLPYYRELYFQRAVFRKVSFLAQRFDNVIISWEPLDVYALAGEKKKTLVLHNITSDAARQIFPNSLFARVISLFSLFWEKRIYNSSKVNAIVVLSKRDRELVRRIAPRKRILVASPGAPPAVELDPQAQFLIELVISGSFEWFPKRRDVMKFRSEFLSAGLGYPILYDEKIIRDGNIRIGIITDRFVAGHKLKTLFYIANNCVVLSYSDIMDDFCDLQYASRFIIRVSNSQELDSTIRSLQAQPIEDFRLEFRTFKAACLKRFTWENTAKVLGAALNSDTD